MRILDIYDPPPPSGREERPRPRLVSPSVRVAFRRPEDPQSSWTIKVLGILLGIAVTALALAAILFVAALLREVYHKMDAAEEAHAAARAKAGAIRLSLPKQDPNAPSK